MGNPHHRTQPKAASRRQSSDDAPFVCVEFESPDVSKRDTTPVVFSTKLRYDTISKGFNYIGNCGNKLCDSYRNYTQTPGRIAVRSGFGEIRPNEDYCEGRMVCPACEKL